MGKRGCSSGRGTGRGVQATGCSAKNENTSKQGKEPEKNVSEEQVRKLKEKEKSKLESLVPMSTRARTANDKKKAEMDNDKPTCGKLEINDLSKKKSGDKKPKVIKKTTKVLNVESPVNTNSLDSEILSCQAGHLTEKAYLACASPLSDEIKFSKISEIIQELEKVNKTQQKLNLDPLAKKVLEVLASEIEKEIETKSKADKSVSRLQYSKADEIKMNSDLKAVKMEKSSKEMKETESNTNGNEISILRCSNDTEELKLNLGPKATRVKKHSSKKEKKRIAAKLKVDDLTPTLGFSQDIEDQKLNLKSSQLQQEPSLEIAKTETESKPERNKFATALTSSKDIDNQKLNLDLNASEVKKELFLENEISVTNLEAGESPLVFQDSRLMEINEKMQSIDINSSIIQHVISPENRNKLKVINPKDDEEIINLRTDANLHFEFNSLDIKTVLVDNKDCYTVDNKQKMTFNIGDGDMQLHFIDNKVCISTQKGEIDCCIRNNQLLFSLKDDIILKNSSPEVANTSGLYDNKSTKAVEDHCSSNITGQTKEPYHDESEETHPKQYKNIDESLLKINSSLMGNSLLQKRIQITTETFLARVASLCDDFELEFLECLKKGDNESPK